MAGKRLVVICAFILSLLVAAGAGAQARPVPPDIQAIINKLKSAQGTTPAEEKRLKEWSKSMRAAASGGGTNNATAASASAAPAAAAHGATPCPPAHALLVTAAALAQFRKSLSKSYSGVVAVGYTQAQQAEEQQQQQQNSTEPPPSFPPSGSADSSPLPELLASADPQETLSSNPAFQQAMTYANTQMQAAMQRVQDAQARVLAIGRRAQIDPDGTINLPRVFDKQLFEYRQIAMLTRHPALPGMPVEEIIERCKPPEPGIEEFTPTAWFGAWLALWAYYAFPDSGVRDAAIDLALEQQSRR